MRDWIPGALIASGRTTVAVVDGQVVGFLSVSNDARGSWIDQLYLLPEWTGRGLGSELLELARGQLPAPIRLRTFQANQGARRFYERHGFRAAAFGDGSGNEERCPDVLYEWAPERSTTPSW